MIKIIVLTFTGLLSIASSSAEENIPGNSFAAFSAPVKKDLLENITIWIKRNKGCDSFKTISTAIVKTEGNIEADQEGHLFGGVLYESWQVSHCNTESKIGIVIKPDGNGGTLIAIAEYGQ